jgi:formylglycine-generating enzyme required for sulfatase activity
MPRFFLKAFLAWLAALACLLLGSNANAGIIEWVRVGDPGNAAAANGFGDVATSFEIMKYEYTNQLYTDFLNSVAKTDTYSLYNTSMGSNVYGGITRSGSSGSYEYSVKTNMGDKPVTYVSWFDAARVCNWAMNGATSSSSTETGAYTLINGQTSGAVPAVNSNAKFFVPTEDQWYKAAYYKGGGRNAGYWNWATKSDEAPTPVTASSAGVGSAGFNSTSNSANFNPGAGWGNPSVMLTTVGTNGRPSFYGAFDMSGNLSEWNDLTGAAGGTERGSRGGNYGSSSTDVSSSFRNPRPATAESAFITFRIAAVPEPSTWAMGAAGIACAGLEAFRRRRAR